MRILESRYELHCPYNNACSHLLAYRISRLKRQCLLACQRCGKLLHKSDVYSVIKILPLQPCMETIVFNNSHRWLEAQFTYRGEAASIPCPGVISRSQTRVTTLLGAPQLPEKIKISWPDGPRRSYMFRCSADGQAESATLISRV
jgi:hypothetical protein